MRGDDNRVGALKQYYGVQLSVNAILPKLSSDCLDNADSIVVTPEKSDVYIYKTPTSPNSMYSQFLQLKRSQLCSDS